MHAELLGQWPDDLGESAGDQGQAVAQRVEGPAQGASTGGHPDGMANGRQGRDRSTGKRRHPVTQGLGEVQLAGHGPARDVGDGCLAPRFSGQQVDHLVLDQGGIHIHDDQAGALPDDVRGLHSHIHADLRRYGPEGLFQDRCRHSTDRDLDGRDRVLRCADYPLDVAATVGDFAGDPAHIRGGQGRGHEHGDGAGRLAVDHGGAFGRDVQLQTQLGGKAAHGVHVFGVDGHRQHQPALHHELFDVAHFHRIAEASQELRGDAGAVPAGEGERGVHAILRSDACASWTDTRGSM